MFLAQGKGVVCCESVRRKCIAKVSCRLLRETAEVPSNFPSGVFFTRGRGFLDMEKKFVRAFVFFVQRLLESVSSF